VSKGGNNKGRRGSRDDFAKYASSSQRLADKTKTLLAAKRAAEAPPPRIERAAPNSRVELRYATTASPLDWLPPTRSEAVFGPILDAIEDGGDRLVLGWPNSPAGAFIATALGMKHARATGRLAYASVAIWPWRNGATWTARSILLNPADIAKCAAFYANQLFGSPAWTQPSLAHESLGLIEMRLKDLAAEHSEESRRVVVRSPTLFETSAVFPPQKDAPYYLPAPEQVLRRVRDHTKMKLGGAELPEHVAAISDPNRTPYAIFGLPVVRQSAQLQPFLQHSRMTSLGLDAIVVDLTRTGRSDLIEDWQKPFETFVGAVPFAPGRRPPLIVLTDDVYIWNKAGRLLRARGALQRPQWKRHTELGALLLESGLLGHRTTLPSNLPPLCIYADIKDASLAPLRRDALRLGEELKAMGATSLAEGVSEALALLRRVAGSPLGLNEAAGVIDILYSGEDELHARARALFRPKMALARLAAAAHEQASCSAGSRHLQEQIERKLKAWTQETPVSLKLASLLAQPGWNEADTLITIPDVRVAEAYLASDRALGVAARVVDHRAIGSAFRERRFKKLIALSPTPELIRTLLIDEACPSDVTILGDAAGTALILAQLRPLTRISAFQSLAERAVAIQRALERGGSDESLDLAEAQFRIAATPTESSIDFTQAGETWEGDVIEVRTSRLPRIAYRPNSDVLVYSPGETRPFERKSAREVRAGDHILVLDAKLREPLRQALAGSKKALSQLKLYHNRMNAVLRDTPGGANTEKARHVLSAMRAIDATFGMHEEQNIIRWLTAGQSPESADGTRQPRAARDKQRFDLFMRAVGIETSLAELYWDTAIEPSRAYRALEGYLFNQRVVQFVLDPEGAVGSSWANLASLWQHVIDAVDEVAEVRIVRGNRNA
jgi:hypothetical protein